jgi:hypothetical protein
MKIRLILAPVTALLAAVATDAAAHVSYHDLDAAPALVSTTFSGAAITDPCTGAASGCQSSNAFTRFGWVNGTQPALGDSHSLTVNAEFWKFQLSQTATVTITVTQGQAGLDPAFSVYRGLLPDLSHDDTVVDPLNPVSGGCAVASPTDAATAPWTYQVHDGFRDTAQYSTTGGLAHCLPAVPFRGQFDAFAGWSMANAAGQWARIEYVASVSGTAFTGHAGGSHAAGSHSTAIGTGETLTLVDLPAGDYTIAVGGEACSTTVGSCTSPRLYATVTYSHVP